METKRHHSIASYSRQSDASPPYASQTDYSPAMQSDLVREIFSGRSLLRRTRIDPSMFIIVARISSSSGFSHS